MRRSFLSIAPIIAVLVGGCAGMSGREPVQVSVAGIKQLLLIEPRGVPNTGEEGGERTAQNDVWI